MKFRRLYLPFLLLLVFQQASAQQDLSGLSNLRYKTFPVRDSILMLDSTSLVPGSVMVLNMPNSYYSVNEAEDILRWIHIPVVDTVRIRYRVLPYKINQVYRGFNYDSIRNNFLMEKKIAISPQKKAANTILDFGNINYNGSMGRGISFGNAQDAVVNSSLNLQLNGIVGDNSGECQLPICKFETDTNKEDWDKREELKQLRDKVLELLHKEVADCFIYNINKTVQESTPLIQQYKFQIYLKDIVEKAKGEGK